MEDRKEQESAQEQKFEGKSEQSKSTSIGKSIWAREVQITNSKTISEKTVTQNQMDHMHIDIKNILPIFIPISNSWKKHVVVFDNVWKSCENAKCLQRPWVSQLIDILLNDIAKLIAKELEKYLKIMCIDKIYCWKYLS